MKILTKSGAPVEVTFPMFLKNETNHRCYVSYEKYVNVDTKNSTIVECEVPTYDMQLSIRTMRFTISDAVEFKEALENVYFKIDAITSQIAEHITIPEGKDPDDYPDYEGEIR